MSDLYRAKVAMLTELGISCGPGCICADRLAASLNADQLQLMAHMRLAAHRAASHELETAMTELQVASGSSPHWGGMAEVLGLVVSVVQGRRSGRTTRVFENGATVTF